MHNIAKPIQKQFVIYNGELRSSVDASHEMVMHENTVTISPLRDSKITLYIINNNLQSLKQTIIVNFRELHAEVSIFGLYDARDKQTMNITTHMNHLTPHCTSRQLWKGVLFDAAKVVFEGNIDVAKHAQKSIATLQNKNLLLSKQAEVSTRPFLKINANDVQCSHGATIGFLNQEALFYLRSRGILESDARSLLIESFMNEILESAPLKINSMRSE